MNFCDKKNNAIECDVHQCKHNGGCNCQLSKIKVTCGCDSCTCCGSYEEGPSK